MIPGVDFDRVLAAGQRVFGRPIIVTPIKSIPGQPPYPARGVWASKPIDIQGQDGAITSGQNHTVSIRVVEFPAPIRQGDYLTIPASGSLPAVGCLIVQDGDDDGQGATELSLKLIADPPVQVPRP